ncbi:MAG: glutathione S-transferase family protein, partial [Solirubrobacterales bacterium]
CRVQGSLSISRALDDIKPQPPLFPADPRQRSAVEEAERWGENELQPPPRNMFRWCASRDYELRRGLAEATGLPAPPLAARLFKPVSWYFSRVVSGSTEASIRADLAALPAQLDRVDELIAEGVIGAEEPNAADFQIATSVRVLMNFPQLRPLIEPRPGGELAMRIAPRFGRPLPIQLPSEWVPEPAASGVSS